MARIARILPAFGFGGLGNKRIRAEGHAWIKRRHQPKVKGGKEPVVVLGREMHVEPGGGKGGRERGGNGADFFAGLAPKAGLAVLVARAGVGGRPQVEGQGEKAREGGRERAERV